MEGLTQDGLAYCGLVRGGASNTEWRQTEGGQILEFPVRHEVLSYTDTLGNDECKRSLAQTIEAEIIPRLMLLHGALPGIARGSDKLRTSHDMDEAVHFCELMLHHSVPAGTAFVEELLCRGFALESLYLDLFAPAARRLGEMWEVDLCDFADVTIGLGRLQQVLHAFSSAFRGDRDSSRTDRSALLVAAPGEQHSLGLFMVSEFFRKAGWDVWGDPPGSLSALVSTVGSAWFDVVGISAGSKTRLEVVTSAISVVRKASVNRAVRVLVGGPLFVASPELVLRVGADAMAVDAREAVTTAEALVAARLSR
jgi:methanogenic corrinoid protein MtbC1